MGELPREPVWLDCLCRGIAGLLNAGWSHTDITRQVQEVLVDDTLDGCNEKTPASLRPMS